MSSLTKLRKHNSTPTSFGACINRGNLSFANQLGDEQENIFGEVSNIEQLFSSTQSLTMRSDKSTTDRRHTFRKSVY
jgi:hypothetical protein